ncbi:RNA polymerase II transcriptional coactivator SUB1 [Yarrowia sp. B02]|nr:RNA polymerase II transcriptional coactivator SUB1 [Yarrowia sp. B02]
MAEDKVFELGKDKRVTVREFKGRTLIDIRAFYEKDGQKLPGSKGISLTEEQWEELVEQIEDVQEAVWAIKDEKEGARNNAKENKANERKAQRENDKKRKAEEDAEKETKTKEKKTETETKKTRAKKVLSDEFVKEEDDF